MFRAYLRGARLAARHWPLTIALWIINGLFGAGFALASGYWLTRALDGSLATKRLGKHLDVNVLIDLYTHHREGLEMVLLLAAVLAAVHVVLWWWLHGVILSSLHAPSASGPGAPAASAWLRGLQTAPAFARLFGLAMSALALFGGAVGGVAYTLMRWTWSDPSPMIWYRIAAGASVSGVLGLVFLVAVHDQARIRVSRSGQGALAAYRWALAFVCRGGERAFGLAVLLQLTALAIWGAYQIGNLALPVIEDIGLTESLLWGQAFLWVRMGVRVWFFAAQSELQS